MNALGYLFSTLALIVAGTIWRGYVLSVLWAWFVVTSFDAPKLGIAACIGLSFIVSFTARGITRTDLQDKRTYSEKLTESALIATFLPLLMLAAGAIVKQWL